MDSVWVDTSCMVRVRPEYWGTGINTEISAFFCKNDIEERRKLEDRYLANISDLNTMYVKESERTGVCNKQLLDKDAIIAKKDSALAIKDSIRNELNGQLKDTKHVLGYWRSTAIGLFLVAVVEGIVIYATNKD